MNNQTIESNSFCQKKTINCNGKLIDLSKPQVMGILNISKDSFYDGGKYTKKSKILERVKQIVNEGAKIIDIGAYSTRPGAKNIKPKDELNKLSKTLEIIRNKYTEIIISVDTFRANIAKRMVNEFKVDMINDIGGGTLDKKMFETIAQINVPYIMMHILGTPQTMQINPVYNNIVAEIIKSFSEKINKFSLLGVKDIILDPGFGFGKTINHNYELLRRLNEFYIFKLPILVGISRKSMIYKKLKTTAKESLNGTTVLNTISLINGANILRVHDVRAAVESVKLFTSTFEYGI